MATYDDHVVDVAGARGLFPDVDLDDPALWLSWDLDQGPDPELNPNAPGVPAVAHSKLMHVKPARDGDGDARMKMMAPSVDVTAHFHPSQFEPLNANDYLFALPPQQLVHSHHQQRPKDFYDAFAQAYCDPTPPVIQYQQQQPEALYYGGYETGLPPAKRQRFVESPEFQATYLPPPPPPPPRRFSAMSVSAASASSSAAAEAAAAAATSTMPMPVQRRGVTSVLTADAPTLLAVVDDLRNADPGPQGARDERAQRVFTWHENMSLLLCAYIQVCGKNPFKTIISLFNRATEERIAAVRHLGPEGVANAALRPLRDRSSLRKRLQKLLHVDQLARDWASTRVAAAELFVVSAEEAQRSRRTGCGAPTCEALGVDQALWDSIDLACDHMRAAFQHLRRSRQPLVGLEL